MLASLRAYASGTAPQQTDLSLNFMPSLMDMAGAGIWAPRMPPLPLKTPGTCLNLCTVADQHLCPTIGQCMHWRTAQCYQKLHVAWL